MPAAKVLFRGALCALIQTAFCVCAFAGAWDSAHLFDSPSKTVDKIVVTGNFVKARLIAELARKETRTPYLLLPAPGESKIFFIPAGSGPALEIRESDLPRFVEFIKPKQIIALGDTRFTPDYYIGLLGPGYEKTAIDSDNWYTNATTLGNLLDCKSLPDKFLAALPKTNAMKWNSEGEQSVPKPEPVLQLNQPAASEIPQEQTSVQPPKPEQPLVPAPETAASPSPDEPVLLIPQTLPPEPPSVQAPQQASKKSKSK